MDLLIVKYTENDKNILKMNYLARILASLVSTPVARVISVFKFDCTNASAGYNGCEHGVSSILGIFTESK